MTKCTKCGHDTNHKTGICIACNFNTKFGQGEMKPLPNIPASRPIAKKQTGDSGGGNAGSAIPTYPYLLDDLQLLILAQVGYIFDLAKEGKLQKAVNRIKIVSKAVKNAKN